MKLKSSGRILIYIIFTFLSGLAALASFPYYTNEELIDKSDLIIVGELVGPTGEEEFNNRFWWTEWQINIEYVIKGEVEEKAFIIRTPGAKDKNISTSIDFTLNDNHKYVLLFLYKSNDFYVPFSPQAIEYLMLKESNSDNLFTRFEFYDESIKNDIESYTRLNNITLEFKKEHNSNNIVVLISVIVGAFTIVFLAFRFLNKKLTRNKEN
ncbi:hypothetical protein EDC18_101444 [Natranaerovirga pectinivora]|uniref:Uncharacterized protein n=1 Tax=Natranaerovirga pectinivora TaxID=682400 RepID=A0A4R3MV07_9FIRM|nr:hypothetical protein [Natranaerovirga pectinivora]TCT17146.1 hypothetical protein EDC18_101444 [Natranaerovirga pectinivora]